MRCLLSQRLPLSLLLLFSLCLHLIVAHHDGMSELILCERKNGELVVESQLDHDFKAYQIGAEDGDSSPGLQAHTSCHDSDLSAIHPNAYTGSQSVELASHALAGQPLLPYAASLPLAVINRHRIPQAQPPPGQREKVLTTTILLI